MYIQTFCYVQCTTNGRENNESCNDVCIVLFISTATRNSQQGKISLRMMIMQWIALWELDRAAIHHKTNRWVDMYMYCMWSFGSVEWDTCTCMRANGLCMSIFSFSCCLFESYILYSGLPLHLTCVYDDLLSDCLALGKWSGQTLRRIVYNVSHITLITINP